MQVWGGEGGVVWGDVWEGREEVVIGVGNGGFAVGVAGEIYKVEDGRGGGGSEEGEDWGWDGGLEVPSVWLEFVGEQGPRFEGIGPRIYLREGSQLDNVDNGFPK